MSILFFDPIPRPAIWGHTLVRDYFGYKQFPEGIGQSWSFSAQKDASTICLTEPYKGITLRELWKIIKNCLDILMKSFQLLFLWLRQKMI